MRFCILLLLAATTTGFARLADTQDHLKARYGLQKKGLVSSNAAPLREGAKELVFLYEGWIIRCSLLRATDGIEYTVRQEYRKLWNSEVMQRGGTMRISDFERDAVLKGEAAADPWREKLTGDLGRNPIDGFSNQITYLSGITGKVWVRGDGAVARVPFGGDSVVVDLPQARKYEAELKAIKDQKARAAVPKF